MLCLCMHFGWEGVCVACLLIGVCACGVVYSCKISLPQLGSASRYLYGSSALFSPSQCFHLPFGIWLPLSVALCSVWNLFPPSFVVWIHRRIAAVVSSSLIDSKPFLFLSLSFCLSVFATSAPAPVVPPPVSLSFPRWENRNGERAAGQPADRRTNTKTRMRCLVHCVR